MSGLPSSPHGPAAVRASALGEALALAALTAMNPLNYVDRRAPSAIKDRLRWGLLSDRFGSAS